MLALVCGKPWPEKYYDKKEVCGVKIDQHDSFSEAILYEEI